MLLQSILLQSVPLAADAASTAGEATEKSGDMVAALKSLSLQDLLNRLAESAVSFAIDLAIAIVVFYVGRFIIRKIYGFVRSVFVTRRIDASLTTFVLSLINIVLYFILIVTVIGIIGIETTSFLALFASAGVAIGMALSGTLQNFAGGVLILLLKPYKIGDFIEVQGYAGTVKEIQIFFTVITTGDNKSILIPNGGLSTGSVNNYSREEYRRISWTVSISYGDDVAKAREAILALFAKDDRIMPVTGEPDTADEGSSTASTEEAREHAAEEAGKRPGWFRSVFGKKSRAVGSGSNAANSFARGEIALPKPNLSPAVLVNELGASSVDLQVRAWVKSADYWTVFFHYNELFYNELPKYGISFPFPQLDVHVNGSLNPQA